MSLSLLCFSVILFVLLCDVSVVCCFVFVCMKFLVFECALACLFVFVFVMCLLVGVCCWVPFFVVLSVSCMCFAVGGCLICCCVFVCVCSRLFLDAVRLCVCLCLVFGVACYVLALRVLAIIIAA